MNKVAITGNIGSGKTSCCRILEILGYPVYYADIKAKMLMEKDENLKKDISSLFGPKSYSGDKLNREYLARKVFSNQRSLDQLNALVHPAVHADMQKWMQIQLEKGAQTAFEEAALTFEAGHQNSFDYVITVAAPPHILIDRVVARDNSQREDAERRLDKQMSQKEKCQQSDAIILNDGHHSLIFQLKNIIDRLGL